MPTVSPLQYHAMNKESPNGPPESERPDKRRSNGRWLALVAAAVAIWGLLLAAGAYFQPGADAPQRDPRRFWIVLGCVGAFLAVWGLAIWSRSRRNG